LISKKEIHQIRLLERASERRERACFVAEGPKTIADIARKLTPIKIYATDKWMEQNQQTYPSTELQRISDVELQRISFLKTPQQCLAIFPLPNQKPCISDPITIALDSVQDPGNLGTIIRLAHWFGIKSVVCSDNTADPYAPKTIQATMGSIAAVDVCRTNLCDFLDRLPKDVTVCGTFLDGEDIHHTTLPEKAVIVMGNEGNGISPEIAQRVSKRLFIPPADKTDCPDSLNVAIATAVTLAAFQFRK